MDSILLHEMKEGLIPERTDHPRRARWLKNMIEKELMEIRGGMEDTDKQIMKLDAGE